MAHFLDRVFGDPNKKTINRLKGVVARVNALEPELEQLSDEDLKARSLDLRQRVRTELGYGDKPPVVTKEVKTRERKVLDAAAPEAFALVREAAKRTLGQRHFDEQLIAGLVLHEGNIAEQRTGEGKTLSATLPSYLNALVGRGTHVVTVNDYLARRDAGWMGQIHASLGLTVACLNHETSYLFTTGEEGVEGNLQPCSRRAAYEADITYGTNSEFGFDYLRDNMAPAPAYLRQRELYFCIVDEVDSILIDEARTPLIISAPAEESTDLYGQFAQLVRRLVPSDYTIDEKERAVRLNDEGMQKMQQALKVDSLYSNENILLVHHLEEALKAEYLFKLDKDYVIREGEIVIVDEFTGRLMPGRRYSEGLHQAIEAKEGVHVQRESDTMATISLQNYFRLYAKLSGMTGTAKTEEEELFSLYHTEVVVVPTHREMIRVDHADKVYIDEAAKFDAIIEEVRERRAKGQPVLIGTISVAKNEQLSRILEKAGLPHEILNAKNHEQEAGIIAEAGKPGKVTLATNMAGRGTDIMLGGTPPDKDDPAAFKKWEDDRQRAIAGGGLAVLGSERHESRRIDNQLRGRSGRQGEPGESIFFVSMDDDLMRIFGGERLKGWMERANVPRDIPIQNSLVSRSIEQAQKRVEGHNFDIRKHVVQYDDVMNKHRDAIYQRREKIMQACGPEGNDPTTPEASSLKETVLETFDRLATQVAKRHLVGESFDWKVDQAVAEVREIAPLTDEEARKLAEVVPTVHETKEAAALIKEGLVRRYDEKEVQHTSSEQRLLERAVMLRTIDALWVEHLNVMQDLRQGIGLQAVAQNDPLVAYQHQGYERFHHLLSALDKEVARQLSHLVKVPNPEPVVPVPDTLQFAGGDETAAGGAIDLQELANVPLEPVAEPAPEPIPTSNNVNVTVRRVSERLRSAGMAGTEAPAKTDKIGRNDPCPCGAVNPQTGKVYKYKRCGLIGAPYHRG